MKDPESNRMFADLMGVFQSEVDEKHTEEQHDVHDAVFDVLMKCEGAQLSAGEIYANIHCSCTLESVTYALTNWVDLGIMKRRGDKYTMVVPTY